MDSAKKFAKTLMIILLFGTLFAWGNFGLEMSNWLQKKECTTGCAVGLVNPFLTPCFYGACFFLLSFVLSIIVVKKLK